jgi:PAS domain S-box-containing protein
MQDYLVKGRSDPELIVRTLHYAIERKRLENALIAANSALEQRVAARTAELEQMNRSLRSSVDRYQAVTQTATDAIITANGQGLIEDWNAGAARLFGYEPAEAVGRPLTLLIPEKFREGHLAGMKRVQSGGERHAIGRTVELAGRRKDASEFPIELSLSQWTAAGSPHFTGTIRDISERKRAEAELHAAAEQFRGLVEQMITGIYVVQDKQFVYVNPRLVQIFGYGSAEELIGLDVQFLVAEKDRQIVAGNMHQRIESHIASAPYQFTGLRKDGSTVEIGVHTARATHANRPALIGMMQDISGKARAEAQATRHLEELRIAFMSTVDVATVLSEMRDPYTAGHERRVGRVAAAIGALLGFDEHRSEGLRVAGQLHDIGKIIVPSEILSKPGRLSAIEYQLVQGHAQAGYEVLKNVKFPWPLAEVALQHHERMDGSGYPQGLKGEATLLEARIMAVADVVEAMSSHRPYRSGVGVDNALAEVEGGSGTKYDRVVVAACLSLFREKGYTIAE